MIEFGPDVSHWESRVDFASLLPHGMPGVFLKATQGSSWVDPTFVSRVGLAQSVGLMVGAYHFCDASDPVAQVCHFLLVAGAVTNVLALDIEHNSSSGGTVSLTQAAEMVSRLQSITDRMPVVYMPIYGPDGQGGGLPNAILARCPLWVPHYTNRRLPTLPKGWSTWMFWQYTDTPMDQNRFNGTIDDLRAFWSGQ